MVAECMILIVLTLVMRTVGLEPVVSPLALVYNMWDLRVWNGFSCLSPWATHTFESRISRFAI
jgi:hypothetical protein